MGKFKIGAGLLNEASKELKQGTPFEIVSLPLDLLDPSEDNAEMSLNDIEELAQSILDNGLDQNLTVLQKEDGRYKVLSGHRRRLALLWLVEHDHPEYNQAPCLVKDLSVIPFQISTADKEKWSVLTTNVQRRNNTLKDNITMMKLADEVFQAIKAAGGSVGKRREWIAQQLGVSPSTVRELTHIENNAAEPIKAAIEEDKLPLTVAAEIARLPEEQQHELAEEKADELPEMTVEDVQKFKVQKEAEPIEPLVSAEQSQNKDILALPYIYGRSDVDKITKGFDTVKRALKEPVNLRPGEHAKLLKAANIIAKQQEKIQEVLSAAQNRYEKSTKTSEEL